MNKIRLWLAKEKHKITGHLEIWLIKIILADPFNLSIINFTAALFDKNKLPRQR